MQQTKRLKRVFGVDEFGFANIPVKYSNIKIGRVLHDMGCGWCYPHGFETYNATCDKNRRSWKYHRKNQYRRSH